MRKWQKTILFLLSFIISAVIISVPLRFIKPTIIKLLTEIVSKEAEIIELSTKFVLSLIDALISAVVAKFVDKNVDISGSKKAIKLLITPIPGRVKNISGPKIRIEDEHGLTIYIGDKHPPYRIIYAMINNYGETVITALSICKQTFNHVLATNESCKISFVIPVSLISDNADNKIHVPVCVWDEGGRKYRIKFVMALNIDSSRADFILDKR